MKKRINIINKILIFIFLTLFGTWISVLNNNAVSIMSIDDKNFDKAIEGVPEITDGDTIKIGNQSIRLTYIDAPEKKQTCFNENNYEYLCGEKSKEFLINLIKNRNVICHYNSTDIYNRILGICFIDNISINEEMIKNGMAILYNKSSSSEKYIFLEEEAKKSKNGLWSGQFLSPQEFRKANRYKNRKKIEQINDVVLDDEINNEDQKFNNND